MLKILGLSLFALVVLSVLVAMVVVNIRDHLAHKSPPQTPDETRGPFTRPTAPANPGVLRTSDHTHMQSGTIRENRNPEHAGALRVRPDPLTSSPPRMRSRDGDPFDVIHESMEGVGRSMNDVSRAIHEAFMGQSPAAPGVLVRVTTTEEAIQHPGASPERIAHERLILNEMLKARQDNEKATPVVKRVSRYKRKPVI